MTKHLQSLYLDWVNNWLTINAFCDHHDIDPSDAITLIELGRKYHEHFVEQSRANVGDFA